MPRKPKAKLYLRFRTLDGKQSPYCPALFDHKSRVRPFWCLVKGVEELHRDGTYYRRVKRAGKWQWESLGNDANAAYAKLNVPRLLLVTPLPAKARNSGYFAGLRRTSRATAGTVPLHGKVVTNRRVPCLSRNVTPDCSESPTNSPHSGGTLATQAPNTSCGEALAGFVGKNNSLAPIRIKTASSTFTILFFIESLLPELERPATLTR